MRTTWTTRFALASLCALWAFPNASDAQGWRDYDSEGPGFRVGQLELHPGIGAEIGFDNNVFYEDTELDSAAILRLTAHLDVSTLNAQRRLEGEAADDDGAMVAFRGGVEGSFYHYFTDRVRDQAGDRLSGKGRLNLMINPNGRFTVRLHELFERTVRPFTDADSEAGETIGFGRNHNEAGIEFQMRSRGDVLKGRLGYTHKYSFYDDNVFDYATRSSHVATGGLSWRFFPTTTLLYETEVDFSTHPNEADAAVAPTLVTDGIRVENRVGVNGAVTDRFSLTAMVGYGVGFYDQADDYDSVTGRLEARWRPRDTVQLALGYERRFSPSLIGNFSRQNRIYLNATLLMIDRLLIGSKNWLSFDKSGAALRPDVMTNVGDELRRKDIRGYASLYGEYRFTDWLAMTAEAAYSFDLTDFDYSTGGLPPLVDPPADYGKVEAWLGLRVFY